MNNNKSSSGQVAENPKFPKSTFSNPEGDPKTELQLNLCSQSLFSLSQELVGIKYLATLNLVLTLTQPISSF